MGRPCGKEDRGEAGRHRASGRADEKNFFVDALTGRQLAMVPENPGKWRAALLTEERSEQIMGRFVRAAAACP